MESMKQLSDVILVYLRMDFIVIHRQGKYTL